MPRALIVGNGSLLATFDEHMQMRDLYYPYVGMEDHTMYGHVHHVGVLVEGKGFSWFGDKEWVVTPDYREDTLVGNTKMRNEKLGIEMVVQDYVHPVNSILTREFVITPIHDEKLVVKCFYSHDLHIYGDKQKDTAFYEPYSNSVIHYRGNRYFLIGGRSTNPLECVTGLPRTKKYDSVLHTMQSMSSCGISSYTVGKTGYKGLEGTWRDAEDGNLDRHAVEQGSVDSTVGIHSIVRPGEKTYVTMWLCAGKTLDEVLDLHQNILRETPEHLERNCHNYWKSWVNKTKHDFGSLTESQVELFKRSLLLIRLHCDNNGGILAAADADIMQFNKDTYTYVWPRDGAFICIALDKAGYAEVTRRFFDFCTRVQMSDGYMMHKYNPDGSLGSSWHPWYKDGEAQMPIQEDETALVLYSLYEHFERVQDFEFLQKMYEKFLKKAARFLMDFRETETGLPLASYDLWEEQRGVFTYTTACTIAGLEAAAKISHILGHYTHSESYQKAADEMRQAMLFHLFDEETQRFVKKIERKNGKTVSVDTTPDMSISAIWKLGILDIDDARVESTMQQLCEMLQVETNVGGLARYSNDYYHAVTEGSSQVPGNPWIITTLWKAQWLIQKAQNLEELYDVKQYFDWVIERTSSAGILAEQYNPFNAEPLSVAPLTWSHATYAEAVLDYMEKEQELKKR